MSEIVFAQPRHEYGSYADLRQLIALSGYDLVYYDEIDVSSDNTYILTVRNGDIENGFPQSRARIILYDLEYRREVQPPIPGISDVWHMDKSQAELIGAKYVPVGGHAGLRLTDDPLTPIYDVAYLMYMIPRRQRIQNELRERGVRLSPPGAWGAERDAILNASRVYLHVHQHEDIPAVPGLRMVVAAAYKLPFYSEAIQDKGVFESRMLTAEYTDLAGQMAWWKNEYNDYSGILRATADNLHQFLCHDLTFRKSIEAAL